MRRGKKIFLAGTIVLVGLSLAMVFRKLPSQSPSPAVAQTQAKPPAPTVVPSDPHVEQATSSPVAAAASPAETAPASATVAAERATNYRPPNWALPTKSAPLEPLFPANAAAAGLPQSEPGALTENAAKNSTFAPQQPANPFERTVPELTPEKHAPAEHAHLVEPAVRSTRPAPAVLPAAQSPKTTTEPAAPRMHTVRDGDTLATLAQRYLGDAGRAGEIFEFNRTLLRRPDLLPIGVTLEIPAASSTPPADQLPQRRLVPIPPGALDGS